jgi:hypothetical protein
MSMIYIGIDDTDMPGGPGTGRIAKGLAERLVNQLGVKSLGVSRHQLLIDSRVRSTSHNSSKGLAIITDRPEADLYEPAIDYMKSVFVEGADPGLCICPADRMDPEIIEYAAKCQTTLMTKEMAIDLAARHAIYLKELGGDGGGVIGALASVGLRAAGNDGRVVDLKGIKEIKGLITVAEVLAQTDIVRVQDTQGNTLGRGEVVDSRDWLRPSLVDGEPVLVVKPSVGSEGQRLWLGTEKKFKDMVKEREKEHPG